MFPLLGGLSEGGCVLLVRREKTLSSTTRALLDSVGDVGGVVSEDVVVSTELDLDIRLELLIFFLFNTGEGSGLGLVISFLLRLGEGPGSALDGLTSLGKLDVDEHFGGGLTGGGINCPSP